MLTKEQEKWISHLSNKERVRIIPYDPKTKEVFNRIKEKIQRILGEVEIIHCGSTALGILGQGEIDLYIPTPKNLFNNYLSKLVSYLGEAGSVYFLKRARFVKYVDNIKVEIFLINKESIDWLNLVKFEKTLKENLQFMTEYERLKKESDGLSVQDYYRRKLGFINKVLNN